MKKNVLKAFYYFLAIMPIICILVDMFAQTMDSTLTDDNLRFTHNFDLSFINQITFFSIWVDIIMSIWATCNIIHIHKNNMPNWIVGKNFFTMIASYALIVFILYGGTLLTAGNSENGVLGFNRWYNISKSIIEHFLIPIFIFVFYFSMKVGFVESKRYSTKEGWWITFLPTVYIIAQIIRSTMLNFYRDTVGDHENVIPFPYPVLDPYQNPVYVTIAASLGFIFTSYGTGVLFNYLSNLNYGKNGKKALNA